MVISEKNYKSAKQCSPTTLGRVTARIKVLCFEEQYSVNSAGRDIKSLHEGVYKIYITFIYLIMYISSGHKVGAFACLNIKNNNIRHNTNKVL